MSTLKSVVLVAVASALAIPPAAAMSGYRWKYRAIVVIAGSGGEVALAEQRRIFAASLSGLDERDVVIVWVTGDTVSSELGPRPGMSARQLRTRFGAPEKGFRVVLVGKDGGTKLSRSTPLPADVLFGTIDDMPMRREEMRRSR
jgi:hypothetical protein